METAAGTMSVGGQTYPIQEAWLQIVTRRSRSGNWTYLFLSATTADESCSFVIDCFGLRGGVSLAALTNGRIHMSPGEMHADDTLSDGDDDSLVEACQWTVPGGASDGHHGFRALDTRFALRPDGLCHVQLEAELWSLTKGHGSSVPASADFMVRPEEKTVECA